MSVELSEENKVSECVNQCVNVEIGLLLVRMDVEKHIFYLPSSRTEKAHGGTRVPELEEWELGEEQGQGRAHLQTAK
jgi:hypothetical protein